MICSLVCALLGNATRKAAKIIEIATLVIDDFVKKQKAVQAEVERHRLLQK